jgi:hypothetical protein
MKAFETRIEELKLENDDLVNFRVCFNETRLFLEGEWIDEGINNGFYPAGNIANFYIPTKSGYVSEEWKRNELFKMGQVVVDADILTSLQPFLVETPSKVFIRDTGVSTANVIATFITQTGGDIHCTA